MTYLKNWALVALVIAFKFMLDFHMFLLKAIRTSNLISFSFQTHLRLVWEFTPLVVVVCISPFEQLVEKRVD
jgi:hypothetical protein